MKRSAALEPLSHDHHAGLVFAAEVRRALRAEADPAPLADDVAAFWRDHLVPHFRDEEAFVVPLLRTGAAATADRLVQEHEDLRALVQSVEAGPDAAVLGAFADALVAHIRFEEQDAFPTAERLADAATLARLSAELHHRHRP